MTDIFISYSRCDLKMVSILAGTLEKFGYSVWWDVSGLHGGQEFGEIIEEKLSEAKCAIVIWSSDSVKSKWVKAEASFADTRKILVTAVYRDAQAPMPFNTRHNENLRAWSGNVDDEGFQKLLKTVSRLCPEASGTHKSAVGLPEIEKERKLRSKLKISSVSSNSGQSKLEKVGIKKGLGILGSAVLSVSIFTGSLYLLSPKTDFKANPSAGALQIDPVLATPSLVKPSLIFSEEEVLEQSSPHSVKKELAKSSLVISIIKDYYSKDYNGDRPGYIKNSQAVSVECSTEEIQEGFVVCQILLHNVIRAPGRARLEIFVNWGNSSSGATKVSIKSKGVHSARKLRKGAGFNPNFSLDSDEYKTVYRQHLNSLAQYIQKQLPLYNGSIK